MRPLFNLAARFQRNERGNFAIMTAFLTPVLLGVIGLALNTAQIVNVRSTMAAALDSALVATTRDIMTGKIDPSDARSALTRYLVVNGQNNLQATDVNITRLDIDREARTISADVTTTVNLVFPMLVLPNTYNLNLSSGSSYTDKPVEVAMMLDLTGSMGERGTPLNGNSQTKLQNLKIAATQAVDDMLDRNPTNGPVRVRVALIPYSQGVNAGTLSDGTYIEDTRIPSSPIGLSELNLPANQLIRQVQGLLRPLTDACTTERKMREDPRQIDTSEVSPDDLMVNRARQLGQNLCPPSPIVPLTADKAKLTRAIANFRAVGSTAGHIGIQWTRYLLSPAWGNFLSEHGFGQPAAYGNSANSVRKVAVLMTDGAFNTQYVSGGTSATYAAQLCTALKQNVEVYTIGFMVNEPGAAETLQNCASPDTAGVKHYFQANSAQELNDAFSAITQNMEIVRLTN